MEDVTEFLKNIFDEADVNSDGFLTKIEVKQILQRKNPQRKISRSEVKMMMKQMDVNNDGKISFEGILYNQVLKINSKKLFFRFSEFKLAIFEQEQNIVIDEK